MPYAPSPMYCKELYRGPTSNVCPLTTSTTFLAANVKVHLATASAVKSSKIRHLPTSTAIRAAGFSLSKLFSILIIFIV
ncbi:hypothetical protein TNIN_301591 [Trichonephila inaurata madagascariensis]|uniref:Uncharacterized protein n=1 Tax=Trichonephila inaurata madagascariensis TaxID=2747483 RepID=A0A8X6YRC9_9ARAC|nr:hypothetical protein TNIN_301591 [Trichonephila inaurata madagascariensis]